MRDVDREIDRVLTLLRNKIREQGFTQLEVQERLGWGRSYVSQLLTKQKSLRVEQVLQILEVIGVDAAEFWSEVFPRGSRPVEALEAGQAALAVRFERLLDLLVEMQILTAEEVRAAMASAEPNAGG